MKNGPCFSVDPTLLARVPAALAAQRRLLPLNADSSGAVAVAMAEPDDLDLLEDLRVLLGAPITAIRWSEDDLAKAIRSQYGLGAEAIDEMGDSGMVRFVDGLIRQAHLDGATDIHIEPFEDEIFLRFRIDGMLHPVPVPPALAAHKSLLISRVKVMAQMNIAEKRLPQDGRIRLATASDELDIRVSTLPTIHGESLDLRLLPKTRTVMDLEQLGMPPDTMEKIYRLIRRPNGIVLVTGPTGHGKTTTLAACLSRLNTPDKKIVTIEDPVEIRLKGVNQIQVHPKIGLSFAMGLRSILRQDPDVIMVGEVRDSDTAEIAIRSSLTGHLVFSTLHTNGAVEAVARLIDMGIEPYLVASSLSAVLAQRLIRLRCPECTSSPHAFGGDQTGFPIEKFGNDGCEACRFTGFKGRTGIFELFVLDDEARRLIGERAPAALLKERAKEAGLRTLYEEGHKLVHAGLTTIDEVRRVTESQ